MIAKAKDYSLIKKGVEDGREAFVGPLIAQIDLTNNCNTNCVACWCHSEFLGGERLRGAKKREKLSFDIVQKLIDDLHQLGTEAVLLSGAGEPFMHPEIMRVISYIKEKGLKLNIITNFLLMNEERLRALVEAGVDEITASVWAAKHKTYLKLHPNQTKKSFENLKRNLELLYNIKKELKAQKPYVKIYNVISSFNHKETKEMVDFALDVCADYIEFQVVDIIPRKTDFLKLNEKEKKRILKQLQKLTKRKDYLEVPAAKAVDLLDKELLKKEVIEFGRFVKKKALPKSFKFFLDDIRKYRVMCKKKRFHESVKEDNVVENALKFYFLPFHCKRCDAFESCEIDKERFLVKAEFMSILGFGSFVRRVLSQEPKKGSLDSKVVDSLPCYAGWIYTRILTNGNVIPCCKAHKKPVGNIYETSFKDIWNNEAMKEFRHKAKNLPKSDPYFHEIGCYKSCDNLGMNLETHKELSRMEQDSE